MGLFSRKKETAEDLMAADLNRSRLEQFNMTKAWGVKKVATAMQFIYDEEHRWFTAVEGPETAFKEKNPWVVDFDQVTDVYLEVDEWWTENDDKYNFFRDRHVLKMEDYSKVFWRYDFYMVIETTHPQAKTIRYKMNTSSLITKVQGLHLFVRRGWELNGKYKGKALDEQIERMEKLYDNETAALAKERGLDVLTGRKREEGLLEGAVKDLVEDRYVKRIQFAVDHMKRVKRVRKLLLG